MADTDGIGRQHDGGLQRVAYDELVLNETQVGNVHLAFTERTGGVSAPPFDTLNLGTHVNDDPVAVAENRRRVLAALGCEQDLDRLIVPNQVHGDTVLTVTAADFESKASGAADPGTAVEADGAADPIARIRALAAAGADAIVCTAPHVPVLLCFADCVPVVLACENGFAVVHSGWKGTYAGIAGKAAAALARAARTDPARITAFIGPHILGDEYEVSRELIETFAARFATIGAFDSRMLDLSACIRQSLEEVGVCPCNVHDTMLSTVRLPERFFSYRRDAGATGRHAAVAVLY